MDGIMGLTNWKNYTNVIESSYKAGQIKSQLFGFEFNPYTFESLMLYGDIDK
jgi:hypothetical protein